MSEHLSALQTAWERAGLDRRTFLRLVAAGASASSLAGLLTVWGRESLAKSPGAPAVTGRQRNQESGGRIVFGFTADVGTLIPVLSADSISASVIYNLYDALVAIDPVALTPIPWIAESWETSTDGMTYTFKLRADVKFHDGQPLTAEDAAFTINAIRDEANASSLRGRFAPVTDVTATDATTLTVTMNRPYAPLIFYLASVHVMPKHLLEGQDLRTTEFIQHPIGSGPFKFEESRAGDHITLVANEAYHLGRPVLDSVVFRIVPDAASLVAALKTGEVDVAGVTVANLPEVESDSNLTVQETQSWCFQTVGLNLTQERFQDVRVRKAIMHAIPREQMVEELAEGHGYVADSYLPRQSWAHNPDVQPIYRYDLDQAKALMTEAGWVDSDGDGIVEKNGEPFKYTLLSSTNNVPGLNETIQQSMQSLGMDVEIQLLDFPTFLNQFATERNFDFITINMCVQLDPDNPNVWGCGLNAYGFCDPAFDELAAQAAATTDLEARKGFYNQMQTILAETVPRPLLYSPNTIRAVSKRVNLGEISSANYTLGCGTLWPHQWTVNG